MGPRITYPTERSLVEAFCSAVQGGGPPWGEARLAREFQFDRGRTDVVAVMPGAIVVAFEAKLAEWRRALDQAYRNTSFAHQSFVVLPETTAQTAAKFADEFARRSVGLCYIKQGHIVVAIVAPYQEPVLSWLSHQVVSIVRAGQ